MSVIKQRQQDIIDEFSLLDGDMEMMLTYLMEIGEQLPKPEESLWVDQNLVEGCQSKVWLNATQDDSGHIHFSVDSNTAITKGLASLLVRVYSDQSSQAILQEALFFPDKIGMQRFIGTQRSNGFAAMVKQIKLYALAFQQKQ